MYFKTKRLVNEYAINYIILCVFSRYLWHFVLYSLTRTNTQCVFTDIKLFDRQIDVWSRIKQSIKDHLCLGNQHELGVLCSSIGTQYIAVYVRRNNAASQVWISRKFTMP